MKRRMQFDLGFTGDLENSVAVIDRNDDRFHLRQEIWLQSRSLMVFSSFSGLGNLERATRAFDFFRATVGGPSGDMRLEFRNVYSGPDPKYAAVLLFDEIVDAVKFDAELHAYKCTNCFLEPRRDTFDAIIITEFNF